MTKVDVAKIVSEMQNLYKKDKKIQSLICTGDAVRVDYAEKDVISLPENHPLRALLGLLGLPFNKIVQLVGKPDTGKSTWAAESMVAAQKSGATVILWDSEDKFDSNRFKNMGGDSSQLLLIKTNEILKGGELIRRYITAVKEQDSEAKIFVVWDSVGGSQSRSHAERELDDERNAQPGQDAKENGSVMKMIVALINKYPDSIAMCLVNQTYAKIGFMQKGDAASGGTKIEFHSSFIVMLRRIKVLTQTVKGVLKKTGIISQATVTKNHLNQGPTSIYKLHFRVSSGGTEVLADGEEADDETNDEG